MVATVACSSDVCAIEMNFSPAFSNPNREIVEHMSMLVTLRKYNPRPAAPISLASRMLTRNDNIEPATCIDKAVAAPIEYRFANLRKLRVVSLMLIGQALAGRRATDIGSVRFQQWLFGSVR
jgi:hypothetical protein